ncbi:MAG: alanine racemase [Atopobiaceae bacterium]|jgi:alanine racemase
MEYPKNRWAWVEIDLDAIRKNTRAFKDLCDRDTRLMCVVKADAYGHGAKECCRAMVLGGADQFAVATVDEGVELRKAGFEQPILVLSQPPVESVRTLVRYDIMSSVYTSEFALALGECAASQDKVARYHLALDTGMSRIGVMWRDAVEFRHEIDFHRGLECAGTFTHFATADVVGDWDFEMQKKRFFEAAAAIADAGMQTGLVHCDNTPGTILHPDAHADMCRVGIGLYGLQPADSTVDKIALTPAMSVRGRVTRVVEPEVGSGVSYGLTYRVPKPHVQIATVPIGYADGLSRILSNHMEVLVRGKRCRQVGRICMDQFMFASEYNTLRAFKPQEPVEMGDVVTIVGKDGDEEITMDDIAQLRGTINYEVACDFGLRLEKVYA